MKILAVDTASNVASVAIMEDNKLLGEYTVNHKRTHSQSLMPMIDELLKSLETDISNIDVFAAVTGPGSFTGLRIGITTIKSIAYAVRKPVVGITSLDSLAYNIPFCQSLICPILDARNDQVFTAIYKWEKDKLKRIEDYMGVHVSVLAEIIKKLQLHTVFLGDAALMHRNFLEMELGVFSGFAPENLMLQKASSVAQAAITRVQNDKLENCYELKPFYLRKSQAERELEKRNL